jgi:MscS family membrane protein
VTIEDYLPEWMLRVGPGNLAVWQWLGIVVAIATAWILGRAVGWVLIRLAGFATARTTTTFDDELFARLRAPIRALASIVLLRIFLPWLVLSGAAAQIAKDALLASFAIVLVWSALRAIDLAISRLTTAGWAAARPTSRALLTLVGRIGKVLVIVIAGIGFLSGLGLPVASLLAGLGIGGIALAFGAQKTVENLFGAVALGVDQPLREGDFVRLESDVLGTVEAVGLRSTRIRTLDRTVVSLPNGKLADMRIETFAVRDRIRLHTTLGVVYSTTAAQLKEILAGFERTLREHHGLWPNDVVVRFSAFGAHSLDVEIMAWFMTSDMGQFRIWRQEVFFQFMEVVEKAGSAFAFPTRTIHVAGEVRARTS